MKKIFFILLFAPICVVAQRTVTSEGFVRYNGQNVLYSYPYELLLHYGFTQDTIDETGHGYDFTPSSLFGFAEYETSYSGKFANFFDGNSKVTTPPVQLGNKSVFDFYMMISGTNESYRVIAENPGGYRIIADPTDSTITFTTYSSPTDSAELTTIQPAYNIDQTWEYEPIHVQIDIHRDEGQSRIYINGEDKTASGGSVKTDFETLGNITIGSDSLLNAPSWMGLDEFKIYSGNKNLTFIKEDYKEGSYYQPPSDITPPRLQWAVVNTAQPDVVNATFNESLSFTSSDSVIKAFTYEQDATPITIDSVDVTTENEIVNNTIILYAADSVFWDDVLTLSYDPVISGGLEDLNGNQVAAFSDSSVINNTCQAVRMAQFRFENNSYDSYDALDGTTTGSVYNSTYHVEGSLGVILTESGTHLDWSYVDFGDNFSIAFWFHADAYANSDRAVFANRTRTGTDGFAIRYDGVNRRMIFDAVNSSGTHDTAVIGSQLSASTWQHIVFTVDKSSDKVFGYLDGQLDCSDSIVAVDFATNGAFRLGNYLSNDRTVFSWMDDMQWYDGVLGADGVDSVHTNIGTMFSGCSVSPDPEPPPPPPPPPTGDTTFTIYADSLFAMTFENVAADAQVTTTDVLSNLFPTAETWMHGTGDHAVNDYTVSVVDVNAVSDGTGQATRALRYKMDQGEYGLTGVLSSTDTEISDGAKINVKFNRQSKLDYYLSYNVLFRQGMDFVLHGKLPALLHGDYNTWEGQDIMTGISARITFIGDAQSEPEGGITFYSGWCADHSSGGNGPWEISPGVPWQFDVTDSTWYNITIRIGMNDLGYANGFLEGYVNGQLMGQWTGLQLRCVSSNDDWLSIEWFYGGASATFAALYNEWVLFDDFYIWSYKTGYGPTPRQPASPGFILYNLPSWDVYNGVKKETY